MKQIYIIIILLLGSSSLFAQYELTTGADKQGAIKTKVIRPFIIRDATPNSSPALPPMVSGTQRSLAPEPGASLFLFEMFKEPGYEVSLHLEVPQPVIGTDGPNDKLSIEAHWYFADNPTPWEGDFPGVPLTSNWRWYNVGSNQPSEGWIYLHVMGIDASQATSTGQRVFTAKASGYYIGI